MSGKISKWLVISIETLNLILALYALTNMEFLFGIGVISGLFSASQVFLGYKYWESVSELMNNRVVPILLWLVCVLMVALLFSTVGYVVGDLVPMPLK